MPEVKEIKLTLGELKVKEAAIGKLLNCKLPVRTSYRMSKLSKTVIKELTDFEEQRIKLAEKYGELKDQSYTIKPDNKDVWLADLKVLLDEEVTLSFIPICLSDLPENELTPVDIMHLSDFIIDEGETSA